MVRNGAISTASAPTIFATACVASVTSGVHNSPNAATFTRGTGDSAERRRWANGAGRAYGSASS